VTEQGRTLYDDLEPELGRQVTAGAGMPTDEQRKPCGSCITTMQARGDAA
jgi:hypothetical protein